MKDNEIHRLLETAQANYGYANQIVVAIEELCELGAVLSKYPRYDFHDDAVAALKDKVLEETADAIIVLRHVQMIFGIQPTELEDMMDKKLNRLKRWLESEDKSFHHTTEDRAVGVCSKEAEEPCSFPECDHSCRYVPNDPTCERCYYWEHITEDSPCRECQLYSRFTPYPSREVTADEPTDIQ